MAQSSKWLRERERERERERVDGKGAWGLSMLQGEENAFWWIVSWSFILFSFIHPCKYSFNCTWLTLPMRKLKGVTPKTNCLHNTWIRQCIWCLDAKSNLLIWLIQHSLPILSWSLIPFSLSLSHSHCDLLCFFLLFSRPCHHLSWPLSWFIDCLTYLSFLLATFSSSIFIGMFFSSLSLSLSLSFSLQFLSPSFSSFLRYLWSIFHFIFPLLLLIARHKMHFQLKLWLCIVLHKLHWLNRVNLYFLFLFLSGTFYFSLPCFHDEFLDFSTL